MDVRVLPTLCLSFVLVVSSFSPLPLLLARFFSLFVSPSTSVLFLPAWSYPLVFSFSFSFSSPRFFTCLPIFRSPTTISPSRSPSYSRSLAFPRPYLVTHKRLACNSPLEVYTYRSEPRVPADVFVLRAPLLVCTHARMHACTYRPGDEFRPVQESEHVAHSLRLSSLSSQHTR